MIQTIPAWTIFLSSAPTFILLLAGWWNFSKRFTTVEMKIEHLEHDVKDIRVEIKDIRNEIKDFKTEVQNEFKEVRQDISSLRETVSGIQIQVNMLIVHPEILAKGARIAHGSDVKG